MPCRPGCGDRCRGGRPARGGRRSVSGPQPSSISGMSVSDRGLGEQLHPGRPVARDRRPKVVDAELRLVVELNDALAQERQIPAVGRNEVAQRGEDGAIRPRHRRPELLRRQRGARVDQLFGRPDVVGHRVVEEARHPAAPAVVATSPMIFASSAGFDHIGQWLVGRSTQLTFRSSGMPARNAQSGCSFAYFW